MNVLTGSQRVLGVDEVENHVRLLAEICDGTPIIDSHVHATEIIFDRIRYRSIDESVMSVNGPERYRSAELDHVPLVAEPSSIDPRLKGRIAGMTIDRLYRFTGPTVIMDQMRIAGIDRAVLLPVAHRHHPIAEQMEVVNACCRTSNRFIAGYSVHDSVDRGDLVDHIREAVGTYSARVVKVHTNFSELDITGQSGIDRANAIIEACGELSLPIVFHGGESPILGDRPQRRFGILENLKELDWGATRAPVVIAHFGIYGSASQSDSIPDSAISIARKMLDLHAHMYFDTSGVMYPAIVRMMDVVDPRRLIFGSDAFYIPMYRQVASVMHAVSELGIDPGIMRDIASRNAIRIFGLEG